MKKLLLAATLLSAVSMSAIAFAQVKPTEEIEQAMVESVGPAEPVNASDARSLANDQDVADARRTYRNACNQHESAGFCDCVTAGVAQALMPAEVRIAARTIGERINAEGDAYAAESSDSTEAGANSAMRIEQVEAHYADACVSYRG